jgi:hypothetical protein
LAERIEVKCGRLLFGLGVKADAYALEEIEKEICCGLFKM